jgi:hypothetical protein
MENTNTQPIRIYRNGQLSRFETYKPIVYAKMLSFGNKVDYWFTHYGAWPEQ